MTQLLVRYVGLKPSRNDNVAGTGLIWHGQGDVHPVPAAAWDKLKKHPDVWELVPSTTEAAAAVAGTLGAAKTAASAPAPTPAPTPAPAPAPAASTESEQTGEQTAAVGGTLPNWMTVEDTAELRKIAKAMGVAVHHKVSDVAKIREAIAAAQKVEA